MNRRVSTDGTRHAPSWRLSALISLLPLGNGFGSASERDRMPIVFRGAGMGSWASNPDVSSSDIYLYCFNGSSASPNTTYHVVAKLIDHAGNSSAYSAEVSVTPHP